MKAPLEARVTHLQHEVQRLQAYNHGMAVHWSEFNHELVLRHRVLVDGTVIVCHPAGR